ncbi:MAG: NADPH-dependent F420 reductase [Gemmatimonadota bacterium]
MREDFTHAARRRALLRASIGVLLLGTLRTAAFAQGARAAKMKIGVIGSGRHGGAIGSLWIKAGHQVLFSSRHPDELKDLVAGLGPLARAGLPEEAATFGDAILIAVPYGALPQVGRDLAPALKGKVVLDACNAIASRDGPIADEARANGIGITSQRYLPGTRLVRAFNSMGSRILAAQANRPDPKMAIPIAGDDADALKVAADLVRDAGFDPVIVGPLARATEFAMGAPGYGQQVTAPELRQKLSIAP